MSTPQNAPDFGEPWEATYLNFITNHGTFSTEVLATLHRNRIAECVNACAGMPDPAAEIARLRGENEAMRAAIRESHAALGGCLKYILRLPLSGSVSECETMDDAHHALRKLKPFLP